MCPARASEPDGSAAAARGAGEAECGHLHVDWEQYYRLIERLAVIVHESGYAFDSLVCLARGGMRVGDVLSRVFEVPLAILATSSYREDGGTVAGELDIADDITSTGGEPWGRVLLVDDLVDSGNTLERVAEHLRGGFPMIEEIRSAVIWFKASSSVAPDYYVEHLAGNPWIHQPFERYDRLRPADLVREAAERTPGGN
jgi:hypoxanthine phosphoribosyltransferase